MKSQILLIFCLSSLVSSIIANSLIMRSSQLKGNPNTFEKYFRNLRFQEKEKAKELTDEEKLDRIDIELKFGKNEEEGRPGSIPKDKELKRREGLANGLVTYNGKRTMNSETAEFVDFFYETLDKVTDHKGTA